MTYKTLSFDDLKIKSNIYKNKNKCFVLENCIIDLSEFSKHIVDNQNGNLKVYSNNYRVRKYINRNPKTNAVWYEETNATLDFNEYVEESKNLKIDEEINELFFCYDYLEWQYSHFLTDVYPKIWYFNQICKNNSTIQFGQIRPIINFAYNCSDKNFTFDKSKLNLRSDFAEDLTDTYLQNCGLNNRLKCLEKGKIYFVKKLVIPVPFTSQDVINWPDNQFEMYDILINESKKSELKVNKLNFISRKDTQRNGWFNLRYLVNEDEVFDSVKPYGFESVELMNLTALEKIKLYNNSECIIQQVGSNCFNMLFESPNTKNIIIIHPYYRSWIDMLKYICDFKNVKLIPIESGIELLGLNDYPEIYKRTPDQPWTFKDFNTLTNSL